MCLHTHGMAHLNLTERYQLIDTIRLLAFLLCLGEWIHTPIAGANKKWGYSRPIEPKIPCQMMMLSSLATSRRTWTMKNILTSPPFWIWILQLLQSTVDIGTSRESNKGKRAKERNRRKLNQVSSSSKQASVASYKRSKLQARKYASTAVDCKHGCNAANKAVETYRVGLYDIDIWERYSQSM